ncbi:MAG: hypothetical protein CMI15_13450 [Opitutaceae bacterium]|mgnify:CR=1 FL=1|nr:hypothetical protein [Opitutaceae bacterium]
MRVKRPLFKLILLLGIVYTGGHLAYLYFPFEAPSDPADQSPRISNHVVSSPQADRAVSSIEFASSESETPLDFQPPSNLAQSDELLVNFGNIDSYQRFNESANLHGIEIIARNDALLALRLRVQDSIGANQIRHLAGSDASFDYNYLVAAPLIPQPAPSGGGSTPFLDRALDWLGVPENNQEWGKGITIALLDTGVSDHSSLESSSISQLDLIEDSGGDESAYHGHGTAIASLIVGQEGLGIAPAAELVSIQVMDSDGIGDSFTLAEGILQAVESGATIVSMSLGSYGYTSVLENAVNFALANDVVLVASAGNDGANAAPYPARFENVIGVAAVDADSQRADFSNFSSSIDIAAPGVDVIAAWGEENWIRFSGTSAAAPYVAGGIAATMSLDAQLSPQEAASTVLTYSDDTAAPGKDAETGAGSLNMDRVINRDERGIYDAAVGDFYLDIQSSTETTTPLQVTVQNRGTEHLPNVSISLSQNNGYPQKIYLGSLSEHETTSYTLYLDNSQLALESGYSIDAEIQLTSRKDSRPENDTKSGTLRILPKDP